MKLIKDFITTYNPISKFYNKILQLGYDQGYAKGAETGQKLGFKQGQTEVYNIGFDKGEAQGMSNGYQKAYGEVTEYINKTKQENPDRIETNAELTDSLMLFLKSIAEIVNTKFFINTCFDNCDSKFIKQYLDFIDYAESSFELKTNYPQTHYYLPELKKAFKQIYDNKLVVEDAKKLF